MRTYLVVIDDSEEAAKALRFASHRAAKVGGAVSIVAAIPKPDFMQWGGVQATIEDEAQMHAEALVAGAAGTLIEETGIRPTITVKQGDPVDVVMEVLAQERGITALVLGASAHGAPGPLVEHFTGHDTGKLPCPVMIIPGSLTNEDIDRLS